MTIDQQRQLTFTITGRIVDGTGRDAFNGTISIEGDTIVDVCRHSATLPHSNHGPARCRSNAGDVAKWQNDDNLVLAPGFIDIHSHGDHFLLVDPSAASKIRQGVTTDVIGNCGYSAAPLSEPMRWRRARGLERYGLEPRWSSFADYLNSLEESRPAVNVAAMVGHGTIRASIGISDTGPANGEERRMLSRAIADALDSGAFGVTTGLVYAPGKSADSEELGAILGPVSERRALYAAHIRDEGDKVLEALEEALALAAKSNVRFQYSHVKAWGKKNWPKRAQILRLMKSARDSGVDIATDIYPYTSAATELLAGIGLAGCCWSRDEKLIRQTANNIAEKDSSWAKRIRILTSSVPKAAGRRLSDYDDPLKSLLEILHADPKTSAAFHELSDANIDAFFSDPFTAVGSDASNRNTVGVFAKDKPHPRAFGTFPRIFRRYVRERNLMTLEEAVRRMTSLPAGRLGIADRGRIAKGCKADLVAFNPATIADTATFARPNSFPRGIEYVWVNGIAAVENGVQTEERAGCVLHANRSMETGRNHIK